MFSLILEACPSFAPIWQTFLEEWGGESELPYYLALGDLARHLVSKLETGETQEFAAVFDVIERLHTDGEHYVQEAATVGLLEGLQNERTYEVAEPEQFRPFLRPETERWWDKLVLFWLQGKLLTDQFYEEREIQNSLGSGSMADVVRYEMRKMGQKIKGKNHTKNAEEISLALKNWQDLNPTARPGDRAAAENMLKDLENALSGGDPSGTFGGPIDPNSPSEP